MSDVVYDGDSETAAWVTPGQPWPVLHLVVVGAWGGPEPLTIADCEALSRQRGSLAISLSPAFGKLLEGR